MASRLKHRICYEMKKNGFCNQKVCENAHFLEEYSPPTCRWGNSCRFINMVEGSIANRDGKHPCIFLHPCETHQEYYKRTKRHIPNIPNRLLPSPITKKRCTYYHESAFRVPKCIDPDDIIHISVPQRDIPRLVKLAYNQGWNHVKT